MTGRDPRFPSGWWVGPVIIIGIMLWIAIGLALSAAAAESRRGAAPTSEMVDACQKGLDALCEPENAVSVDLTQNRLREIAEIHDGHRRAAARGWFDCDGYVLAMVASLTRLGVPPGAMAWGSGWTADGVHHAWLVLHTTDGEIMLDALRKDIGSGLGVLEYSQVKICENLRECWRF
jgi:predicted transglutaminase-like cysteine proteinase